MKRCWLLSIVGGCLWLLLVADARALPPPFAAAAGRADASTWLSTFAACAKQRRVTSVACEFADVTGDGAVDLRDVSRRMSGADDTAAFRRVLARCADEGRPLCEIPDGTYYLRDDNRIPTGTYDLSGVTLQSIGGDDLGDGGYRRSRAAMLVIDQPGVTLIEGTLRGTAQWPPRTEFRPGIEILGATDFEIRCTRIEDFTEGDGVTVLGWPVEPGNLDAGYVHAGGTITDVTIIRAARNGVSVIDADGLLISNLLCEEIKGKSPQSCLEIEPGSSGYHQLTKIVARSVRSNSCNGAAVEVNVERIDGRVPPVDVKISDVWSVNDNFGIRLMAPKTMWHESQHHGPPKAGRVVIEDVRIIRPRLLGVWTGHGDHPFQRDWPIAFELLHAWIEPAPGIPPFWWDVAAGDGALSVRLDESVGWAGTAAFPKGVQR